MLRNIGSNWALALVQLVVLVQLTPVQVRALGAPAQGAWLTVASLTSVLGLLILGVPMASVRFIAEHVAKKETERANEAIATCLGVCLALGGLALIAGAGLSIFFEHTYLRGAAWQSLGPNVIREARIAYWLVVAQVALGFAGQLPFGILESHHHFVGRNGVKMAGLLLRLALVVGVLRFYPSLIVLGVVQLGVMLTEFAVGLAVVKRSSPEIRFGLRGFDRARLKPILGFSVFAMLLNMGSQLAFQTDQLVINAFGTPEEGTLFDVGNKFFPPLTQIVLGIGMVMMPMATKLQASGDAEELREVFLKWSKVAFSIGLLVIGYLFVLAPEFIKWWMGPSFAQPSARVTRILAGAFVLFLPIRGVASPMLMGLGRPAIPALAMLGMGVVNLVASLALVRPLGLAGVAIGTAIPCALYSIVIALVACRVVDLPVSEYLRYVVLRPSLGALPAFGILVALARTARWFPRSTPLPHLIASGVLMVVVFAASWLLFVYRDDPYFDLAAKVRRFVPRRSAP